MELATRSCRHDLAQVLAVLNSVVMRTAHLSALLCLPFALQAQEFSKGLGFSISACPAIILTEAVTTDNWIGDKPGFGTTTNASVYWTFPKDGSTIGVGGGAFFWGDRTLYPLYLELTFPMAGLCTDCGMRRGIWARTGCEARLGAMFGSVETTSGPLHANFLSEVGLRYQMGASDDSRFQIGLRLGIFSMSGPYQVQVDGRGRMSGSPS